MRDEIRPDRHPSPSEEGPASARTPAAPGIGLPGATTLRWEIVCLLALSLGAAAVSATISFLGVLTATESLAEHTASLVRPQADERPWLDLSWQLYRVAVGLVPVLLVGYLLHRSAESMRTIGFDPRRPGFDLGSGALLAALIGAGGLVVYVVSWRLGMTVTIAPSALEGNWWDVPVLILQAAKNGILEEVVVVGYLLHRLGQLGWSPWKAVVASSVLRAFYHLYQGVGMFFGNLVMGLVFGWFYHRYGRVMPLVVAHTIIDIVAFVGSVYLIGHLDWLPG
ncbi:CPBP family intramembrane glutamic endopeptidase [Nocardiopsis lambiniae]|uniref:CPBP family intramembrane glutamic endopeptidase n=1 Tax=Nocardiopsis lambiniae TaxID=3075539 RepID=A0ABU2MCX9_9ACTN|nr:CPBP family intramembrane glutamic endopeptidase [Nocardiopsis sp. DSM 44743]MDT0329975.1 CPBP family intramembrane glutamic endopeptidase [Nocardiopsis sp. DSM 44743]